MIVSYPSERAALMTAIRHSHACDVSQQLQAVDGAHSGRVYGSCRVKGRGNVHHHPAFQIVTVIFAHRLVQPAAMWFINIAWRIIQIHDSVNCCIYFLSQIALKVQGWSWTAFPISPDRAEWLSEVFCAKEFILERKRVEKWSTY